MCTVLEILVNAPGSTSTMSTKDVTDNLCHVCCTTAAGHLLDFKAAVTDPLNVLTSWKQASNPCGAEPWQGVVCQDGWVVAIKIESSALSGPLTDGLLEITRLQALYLTRNQLYGAAYH